MVPGELAVRARGLTPVPRRVGSASWLGAARRRGELRTVSQRRLCPLSPKRPISEHRWRRRRRRRPTVAPGHFAPSPRQARSPAACRAEPPRSNAAGRGQECQGDSRSGKPGTEIRAPRRPAEPGRSRPHCAPNSSAGERGGSPGGRAGHGADARRHAPAPPIGHRRRPPEPAGARGRSARARAPIPAAPAPRRAAAPHRRAPSAAAPQRGADPAGARRR